jgi:HEAT repeat protein
MSMILAVALAVVPNSIQHAKIELRSGVTPAAAIAEAARDRSETWVGWSVPALAGMGEACCFGTRFEPAGCSLADGRDSWGTRDAKERPGAGEIYILVGTRQGIPARMRIVSPSCPVHGADRRLMWIGTVEAGASLAALEKLLDGKSEDLGQHALAAIAYHADGRADALLERRALDRSASHEVRQQAMFWAGNARGEAGYRLVERILGSDPSGDIREQAVFALSQSPVEAAPERIRRASREDRDPEVRAQALFWLAQTQAAGAGEWIVSRLDTEQSEHVREQAVFALSQLEDGTDWLLDVLRSERDVDTKRRALFWLGQSDDPRALTEIEKILDR